MFPLHLLSLLCSQIFFILKCKSLMMSVAIKRTLTYVDRTSPVAPSLALSLGTDCPAWPSGLSTDDFIGDDVEGTDGPINPLRITHHALFLIGQSA